jgi:hypothetical protein
MDARSRETEQIVATRGGARYRRRVSAVIEPGFPERTAAIRRCTARLCLRLGWAPVHEVPLPNGRRADILALAPDGDLVCIEIKSGARDFLADAKWREYRDYCDRLLFAVDVDFPRELLPDDAGLIVACPPTADLLRDAPDHRMAPARRRVMLQKVAWLSASRLCLLEDPAGAATVRAALRVE